MKTHVFFVNDNNGTEHRIALMSNHDGTISRVYMSRKAAQEYLFLTCSILGSIMTMRVLREPARVETFEFTL